MHDRFSDRIDAALIKLAARIDSSRKQLSAARSGAPRSRCSGLRTIGTA
jgi:hypothetical protein